eukprot:scaffold145717_cov20-Tisochrysis_lutea.AAC.1
MGTRSHERKVPCSSHAFSGMAQSKKHRPVKDMEASLCGGSSGSLSKESSLIRGGSEDYGWKGGRNFGEYLRSSAQTRVTPSKAQVPELAIQGALKKANGQLSTAPSLQPPGTVSSPFAAIQGGSPTGKDKNCKFDLEGPTTNGEAEKQQPLQGQQSEVRLASALSSSYGRKKLLKSWNGCKAVHGRMQSLR